jgi:hypothetical protein
MTQYPSDGFRKLLMWFLEKQDWDEVVDEISG